VSPPVICTLLLDEESQARFDRLRAAHFPPERNHLAAHVTLFHALPADRVAQIVADVQHVCRRPPFPVQVTGVRFLGRGVAYDLSSPELSHLRAALAARWGPWLGRQDRSGFRAHVTVQNKVAPQVARELHARLERDFVPGTAKAEGLALWRYRGGPWEPLTRTAFPGRARVVR
jgi:2'-5' RNA ligase